MSKAKYHVQWEIFCDEDFFYMWAVREVGDKDFNSPRLFHYTNKEDAEKLKELLEKSHCTVKK